MQVIFAHRTNLVVLFALGIYLTSSSVTALAADDNRKLLLDDIYFGSAPVTLRQAPGKTLPFIASEWEESSKPQDLEKTLSRASRQKAPDCHLSDIVVPAIPALDLICTRAEGPSDNLSEVEEALRTPLIKVPEGNELNANAKTFQGVASGARSALIKLASGWYRLKGCGNFDQGFPVRTNQLGGSKTKEGTWRDIRGSAFPHTALRELSMTSRVSQLLEPHGIMGCNAAVGLAVYDAPNLPLGADFPTSCIMEKTLGDRRFGTHVLAGLEILLPLLINANDLDSEGLLEAFPLDRPGRDLGDIAQLVTTSQLMTDYSLATARSGHGQGAMGLTWSDLPRDETTLANMTKASHALPERAPSLSSLPKQWTRDGVKEMSPRWRKAWTVTVGQLQSALQEIQNTGHSALATPDALTSSVLAYLYSRTGYDAGRILGGLHKNRISWGTYQDQMCRRDLDEWHCNAHANNLVVIPEGSTKSQAFLSYLDLDMAFDEKSFVNMEKGTIGISGEDFDHLLWREYVELMEVLAGGDSSTGVPQIARKVVSSQLPLIQAVRSSLYDTLILSYMRGYTGDDKYPLMAFDPQLHKAAHAVMRLAIIIMADYIA